MVILAEELLLLALDERTGRSKGSHLKEALAGALLVDLLQAKRITLQNKRVTVSDPTPVGHPALDQLLATIDAQNWDRKPRSHVAQTRRGLKRRIADGLVEQRVLRLEADRMLRWIPRRRYWPAQPEATAEVRHRLESMVVSQTGWDARTAALGGLVYAGRLEKHALPGRQRGQVRPVLKSAAQGAWEPGAANGSAEAMRAATWLVLKGAMLAAVIGGQGNGNGTGGDGM